MRDGQLIVVDDDRMPLEPGEVPQQRMVRFRSLGCYPLSAALDSTAATLDDVIAEMEVDPRVRAGRAADRRRGRCLDGGQEGRGVLLMSLIRLVACGSVDDGKSTLIGRLLADTDSVPEDILEMARTVRRAGSTIPVGEIDFSLLTDGLEAEREQGITIDVAYRHLSLPDGRRVVIADAPGHEQYTRNMAVAASTADVALLLVDASRGVTRQTFRHLTICGLMGVHHVIIAVNKLDAVDFDHERFRELADEVAGAAARLDFSRVTVIPVSALAGDNVTTDSARTGWYHGPTVLVAIGETHALALVRRCGPASGAAARCRPSCGPRTSAASPAPWSPAGSPSATSCPWPGR